MNTNQGYISLSEKEPLLPEPVNQQSRDNRRHGFINWFRTHTPRLIFTGLWFYLFFAYFYKLNYCHQSKPSQEDESFSIESYNKQQYDIFEQAAQNSVCTLEPGYAFDGVSEFEFDPATFNSLSIEETQGKTHHGIQIAGGETEVSINDALDTVKVKFDIVVSDERLLDTVWIEDTQIEETGQYRLTIHEDDDDETNACIKINIKIEVPSAASLKSFVIALTNNGIEVQEGLVFDDEFKVSIANGHLHFGAIDAGNCRFSVANGHITGTLNALTKGDLKSSLANGHNEIKVKQIVQQEERGTSISLSVANGSNDLEVPVSFESTYHLSNVVGRRIIESSEPTKIHRKSGGWRTLDGYFGDHADSKNSISMSSVNGNVHLNYV